MAGTNGWTYWCWSVHTYDTATFTLSNLQLLFYYDARTCLAFFGRVLRYSASIVDGDHECIAYYMRDNVHEAMNIGSVKWMEYNDLRNPTMEVWAGNNKHI
ncbi:hypothetical protein BU15DRAFT_50674 [Melanogaster broomeanus]|nr:hypothetical protein BU15DRAFT_50674 [Melanogaster broomeanus]